MNLHSIRFRLTAWYALILLVTFAATGVAVWWAIRNSIHSTVDKDLRSRLHSLRTYLQEEASGNDPEPLAEELAEDASLSGTRFRIMGDDGKWVYQSPEAKNWNLPMLDSSHLPVKGKIRTIISDGKPVRVLSAPVELKPKQFGVAQIGVLMDEYYEMLNEVTWTALLASPLVLLFASVGGYWMSRRALEPVDNIARTAAEIGAYNLSERLPIRRAGDELDRLSVTLNSMFARLEAAFQQITQFTADASHELRTPVAIIRTTAELARTRPRTPEEYRKALDGILTESERTSRLIEDLLLLARADAGADSMAQEPTSLAECLRDAVAEVRILAEHKGVTLEAGDPADCTVTADQQAIRRMFLILLDNAIKYTPSGGKVTVNLKVEKSGERPTATVEVRDTGVGISVDDLRHVFERFYRASKDRSRNTGGAGLGLSIARWIAEKHGGEIWADSAPEMGSVFHVRLPLTNEP